jgi:hypothetical protein
VEDGIHVFNAQMVQQGPRKVGNALHSTTQWLSELDDAHAVRKTLRRLGEYIRRTLRRFDDEFPRRARDPLECEIGVLAFGQDEYRDDVVLDFARMYAQIRDRPGCGQCRFRQKQEQTLRHRGIDLYSAKQQATHPEDKGYVKQAQACAKAVRSRLSEPSCWYCDRLGDTIVALSAPEGAAILTGDRQSFPVLGRLLDKPVKLIPSLDELREARQGGA